MRHIESLEYKNRRIDLYMVDTEHLQMANLVYLVYIDGEAVSEKNSMPGPTLELLRDDAKRWVDENT
jgi:hypothetical protein